MAKAVVRKLRSIAGDSIVEALAAILIAAMGAALLATMAMSAMNVISTNKTAMDDIYQSEAAVASATAEQGAVNIKGMGLEERVEVDVYQSDDFSRYGPPVQEETTP